MEYTTVLSVFFVLTTAGISYYLGRTAARPRVSQEEAAIPTEALRPWLAVIGLLCAVGCVI